MIDPIPVDLDPNAVMTRALVQGWFKLAEQLVDEKGPAQGVSQSIADMAVAMAVVANVFSIPRAEINALLENAWEGAEVSAKLLRTDGPVQ